MKKILVFLCLFFAIAASDEKLVDPGGYQGAKWGMSKEEVKAALPQMGKAFHSKTHNIIGYIGKIAVNPYYFIFFFNKQDKLIAVGLMPYPAGSSTDYFGPNMRDFPVMLTNLKAKYGEPANAKSVNNSAFVENAVGLRNGTAKIEYWWDVGNTIIFLRIERDMSIPTLAGGYANGYFYKPLVEYWDKKAFELTAKVNFKIAPVLYEPEGAQNNSWEAPGLFRITFDPLNALSDSIGFVIQSLCDKSLKVYWDDSAYIDPLNNSHRIFHGGTRFMERDKAQPPSIIAPRTKISDSIAPTDLAVFEYGGWMQRQLFAGMINEQVLGQGAAVLLVIGDDAEKKSYMFRFRLIQPEATGTPNSTPAPPVTPATPKATPRKTSGDGTEEHPRFTGH